MVLIEDLTTDEAKVTVSARKNSKHWDLTINQKQTKPPSHIHPSPFKDEIRSASFRHVASLMIRLDPKTH